MLLRALGAAIALLLISSCDTKDEDQARWCRDYASFYADQLEAQKYDGAVNSIGEVRTRALADLNYLRRLHRSGNSAVDDSVKRIIAQSRSVITEIEGVDDSTPASADLIGRAVHIKDSAIMADFILGDCGLSHAAMTR